MSAAHDFFERVAASPFWFHYLRKLPERNYRATKARIAEVRNRVAGPRVLDLGCGTGEFAGLFDPAAYLGVDVSERYVRFGRRLNPAYRFECADAIRWHGAGGAFDLVLVNGVLHHLDASTASSFLRAALRHAAPGATLLVIEDAELAESGVATRLVHRMDAGHHIRTPAEWLALVSSVALVARSDAYRSGVCPYFLMECRTS